MAKTILLSYKMEPYQALNSDGFTYVLRMKRISWWGYKIHYFDHKITIPYSHDSKLYFELWDNKIALQEHVS